MAENKFIYSKVSKGESPLVNRYVTKEEFYEHTGNKENPHEVTKAQVGLEDVVNKPMDSEVTENSENYISSGAVKTYVDAYGGKIDSISIDGTPQTIDENKNVDLPPYPTKTSLGLDNVDNTSDLDKPISTATQSALNNKQDTLVNQTNIKSVDGQSLLGSGNIQTNSYHTFPNTWHTGRGYTTKEFCDSVRDDTSAVPGTAYFGTLGCSDLPANMGQAEAVVEIISYGANGKCINISLSSLDTSPYRWTYSYGEVNSQTRTIGWLGVQQSLQTQTVYSNKGSATKVPQITTNSLGQVTNITEVTITDNNDNQKIKVENTTFGDNDVINIIGSGATSVEATTTGDGAPKITISSTNTTYDNATTEVAGLMSAEDKTKLNGIESGAQVNAANTVIDENYKHITVNSNSVSDGTTTISNIVSDASYVHTDNNFSDVYKGYVEANNQKVSNVQSDWNASSGAAQILNKPTLPDIATSAVAGLVKSSTTGVTANRDYNVEVNNDGTMKVNVPWTDTIVSTLSILVSTQVSDTPSGITWYKYDVSQGGYILITGNLAASSSTENAIYLASNTSFKLLTSEPANWSTNYHSYYQLNNDMYEPVPGASAPTWQASTYYERINSGTYTEYLTAKQYSEGAGEYIYWWEMIGNTEVDLSNYVPTSRTINAKNLASNIVLDATDVLTSTQQNAVNSGLTSSDKTKLDGIEAGAQVNAPNTVIDANYSHISVSSSNGVSDGTNTYKYTLPNDVVQDSSYVHTDNNFTTSLKDKLDGIESQANKTVVDDTLDSSSTNPVQNKVINAALGNKVPTTRTINNKALSSNITLDASDVGALPSGTTYVSSVNGSSGSVTLTANEIEYMTGQSVEWTLDDLYDLNATKIDKSVLAHQGSMVYGTVTTSGNKTTYTPTELTIPSAGKVLVSKTSSGKLVPAWDSYYPWEYRNGQTFGEAYEKYGPNRVSPSAARGTTNYGIQIGDSGFTVDKEYIDEHDDLTEDNLFRVDNTTFEYKGNTVTTTASFKTINNTSIIGSGDITISGSTNVLDATNILWGTTSLVSAITDAEFDILADPDIGIIYYMNNTDEVYYYVKTYFKRDSEGSYVDGDTVVFTSPEGKDQIICLFDTVEGDDFIVTHTDLTPIETYTIASNSWTADANIAPFTYKATATATATIRANTIVELLNDNAVNFATYGFNIGDITGQVITFYSIGQPSSSVSLKVRIGG